MQKKSIWENKLLKFLANLSDRYIRMNYLARSILLKTYLGRYILLFIVWKFMPVLAYVILVSLALVIVTSEKEHVKNFIKLHLEEINL